MSFTSESEWAYLPVPVLNLILHKLSEPIYHAWFAHVCKQWYLVAKDYNKAKQNLHKALPVLMMSINRKLNTKRAIYGITEGKIFNNLSPSVLTLQQVKLLPFVLAVEIVKCGHLIG